MSVKSTKEGLKQVIGVPALAAAIANMTVGAGIYVLPAIVAIQIGSASVLVYLFCAAVLISIMLCYAEVGSRTNRSGGSYIYVEEAFGPFAGFVINWMFVIGWGSLGSAALMNVIADSLSVLFPIFTMPLARNLLFFVLVSLLVLVNVRGAKQGIRFVELITIIKILPLLFIVIFGFGFVKASNLHWEHLPPLKTIGETALVLFFAFAGFETTLNNSGEVENPKRTIPRGILLGGSIVFILYLLIQTVTQGVLGVQINAFKDAPLAAVAEKIIGPVAATVILIAAIISSLGTVGGDVLASPRLLFAGANDGLFPKLLGRVHPRFATPYVAVIAYALLIFVFSISGGFKELAILASGSLLLIYLSVVLATVKFRFSKGQIAEKGFKAPGGLLFPTIATVAIIWLLSHLSFGEMWSTLIFIIIICAAYFVMRYFKKEKPV